MRRLLVFKFSRTQIAALLAPISLVSAAAAQTVTVSIHRFSTYAVAQSINLSSQITGYYRDANGVQLGFLRQRNGTFITFNGFPQVGAPTDTYANDINLQGQITGYVFHPGGTIGFLRQTDGTIVNFNGGATSTASAAMATAPIPQPSFLDGTGAFAISDGGQITGSFGDIICVGFFRHSDGSTINFNVPGPFPLFTIPQAINLWGQITGYYRDFVDNTRHGFLRQANSKVSTFDPAGSVDTQATGINLVGQITGFYATSDGVHHGFLDRPMAGFPHSIRLDQVNTQAAAINFFWSDHRVLCYQ